MTQFVNMMPKFKPPMAFQKRKSIFTQWTVRNIDNIIEWCKKEYWDSIRYWASKGKFRNVRFEVDEFSAIRLMATLSIFDELILFFKYFPFVWDGLSKPSQEFLIKSYELKMITNRKG